VAQFGSERDESAALLLLLEHADWAKYGVFSAIAALNSLYTLGDKARPFTEQIRQLPTKGPAPDARYSSYVPRLIADFLEQTEQ
jgi:hypothetical protein